MTNENCKKEFDRLYGMKLQELKQQDVNTLATHIIELREILSGNKGIKCSCGARKFFAFENNDTNREKCIICFGLLCSYCALTCYDCKKDICINCRKACVHCSRSICKTCIYNRYEDWEITGCKLKYKNHFTRNENAIIYHCIFPTHRVIQYQKIKIYCGNASYLGNICEKHYEETDDIIIDALIKLLPKILINLCVNYFYVKVTDSNWHCDTIKNLRENEINDYDNKLNMQTNDDIIIIEDYDIPI
jgi:hypothetical protein